MPLVRFEAADTATHTQIGEGLTRVARATGRLETGHTLGTYVLRHDDGCADCGATTEAGDTFFLDIDAGDVYCATHGAARRAAE
ncbi:hypothetical protein [Salinigranum halophilum]|jgi:hypothetical protein|uniref:hypothetical protein n=1 Tax=Salinigranum halophilum TaxID=2565931 RepID=UPI0010A8A9F2|nr:hypothetical protein [Salinigranum halophilum]